MDRSEEQAERVARFRSILWSGYLDGSWRDQAACAGVDTEAFFPVGSTGPAVEVADVARAICSTCPVRADCLRFAVATNQQYGIWGGCDEDERRALRRQWSAGRVALDRPTTQPRAAAS